MQMEGREEAESMRPCAVSYYSASRVVLRAGSRRRHAIVAAGLTLCLAAAVVLLLAADEDQDVRRGGLGRPTDLLYKIPGISQETQAHIDSGEWSDEAVVMDMEKGLLPNILEKGPHNSFNATKKEKDPVEDDDDGAKKKKKVQEQGGVGNQTEPETGEADSGDAVPTGAPAAPSVPGAGRSEGGGSKDGTEDDDFGDMSDQMQGHCAMDPSKSCSKDADCSEEGGACVFWTCTGAGNGAGEESRCESTDDCVSQGGVCTGAGHCNGDPTQGCVQDKDCYTMGGICIMGGYCADDPGRGCEATIDCGELGGECIIPDRAWWVLDTNFPPDSDFGPYANWTDVQLKQKLLVLARKILHLQRNMEQQVGVNTHFKSGFKEVASHLPAGVDDSAGGGKNKTERRKMWEEGEADLRQRYDEAEQKVVAEIAPLAPRGQKLAADLKNDDGLQTARILDTNETLNDVASRVSTEGPALAASVAHLEKTSGETSVKVEQEAAAPLHELEVGEEADLAQAVASEAKHLNNSLRKWSEDGEGYLSHRIGETEALLQEIFNHNVNKLDLTLQNLMVQNSTLRAYMTDLMSRLAGDSTELAAFNKDSQSDEGAVGKEDSDVATLIDEMHSRLSQWVGVMKAGRLAAAQAAAAAKQKAAADLAAAEEARKTAEEKAAEDLAASQEKRKAAAEEAARQEREKILAEAAAHRAAEAKVAAAREARQQERSDRYADAQTNISIAIIDAQRRQAEAVAEEAAAKAEKARAEAEIARDQLKKAQAEAAAAAADALSKAQAVAAAHFVGPAAAGAGADKSMKTAVGGRAALVEVRQAVDKGKRASVARASALKRWLGK